VNDQEIEKSALCSKMGAKRKKKIFSNSANCLYIPQQLTMLNKQHYQYKPASAT
jgi:hypothetical protein